MNFLNAIKNLFNRKSVRNGPTAYVYVYSTGKDASTSEVNPNDQVAILRRLSSFVSKKNSPVTIIFPGRPSKKIPDGAKQDGVQARFATSDQLEKIVKQSIAEFQKDHSVILAVDRSEFQRLADKMGIGYSFASTFTKTLDSTCGSLQRETKPQPPRRQPQPSKQEPQPDTTTPESTPQPSEPVTVATNDTPASEGTAPILEDAEHTNDLPAPAPKTVPSTRAKLHRHVPSQKRELTDKAILDLIDPL